MDAQHEVCLVGCVPQLVGSAGRRVRLRVSSSRTTELDHADQVAVLGEDASLPLVGRAELGDVGDGAELVLAVELARERRQPVEEVVEVVGDQSFVAGGVEDDLGVEAVAGGAPLVLLHVPGRHRRDRLTRFEAATEIDDEALGQRRQGPDLTQVGDAVADPHLHRAQGRGGTDVPADVVEVLDHAGVELVLDEAFVLRPGLELEGQAGRRQLLEHHRPVAGVAGVGAAPQRRGGAQCLEVRVVVEQRRHDRQHVVATSDPDMDVQPPDQHLPSPPLGALDQLLVAGTGREQLHRPLCERVRAGGVEVDAERLRGTTHHPGRGREVGDRLGHALADAGDDLDGVAQELLVQLGLVDDARSPLVHRLEELRGCVGQVAGRAVDERELPLHTHGGAGRAGEVDGHVSISPPEGTGAVRRVQRERDRRCGPQVRPDTCCRTVFAHVLSSGCRR